MSDPKNQVTAELDFSASFEIGEFARQMAGCDEEAYYRYQISQLRKKSWTPAAWNLLVTVVSVVFYGNGQRKQEVLEIAREMGATL